MTFVELLQDSKLVAFPSLFSILTARHDNCTVMEDLAFCFRPYKV